MSTRVPFNPRESLEELARGGDPLVTRLAASLLTACESASDDISEPGFREAREMISALAEQHREEGPGPLVAALVTVDEALAEAGATTPLATRLAPLAAERSNHASFEGWQELRSREQAERSPIFRLEERTVAACPVSPLGEAGLPRFVERVLAEVLRARTKRVALVTTGLDTNEARSPAWDALARDLETQLVRLERR